MNLFWAIILGAIQGITELFPISSSAHLVVLPWIFDFSDPGLAFDIALHTGTLFALFIALFPDWRKIGTMLLKKEKSFEKKLTLFLILTTIPGAVFGYLLEEQAE